MKQKNVGTAFAETAILFMKNIGERPAVHAYLEYQMEKFFYGWSENRICPENIIRAAENIDCILESLKLSPTRIAVDGVPGSGKSSLSAALGNILDMGIECLDHRNMDKKIQFNKERTIYEHHRLLRTQDLDNFDLIIYIDEPVELSKEKVLRRKRGAYLVDIMDYNKLKQIGLKAFCMADGKLVTVPESCIKLKIKPAEGFRDRENIHRELKRQGFNLTHTNKEQALFLCVYGKADKGFGAYINPWAYNQELVYALTAAFRFDRNRRGSGRCRQN